MSFLDRIFGSTYKTTVGTNISRAIKDDLIVSSAQTGLVSAIVGNRGQLVEHVLDSMVAGMGIRAERMYASAKQEYANGLPYATSATSVEGKSIAQALIQGNEPYPVVLEYYTVGNVNILHSGWFQLTNNYGYQSSTNEITALSTIKGKPVFLEEMVVVVGQDVVDTLFPAVLEQWGSAARGRKTQVFTPASGMETVLSPTPFRVVAGASSPYIEVTYLWEKPTNVLMNLDGTDVPENASAAVIANAVPVIRKVLTREVLTLPYSYADGGYIQTKATGAVNDAYYIYKIGTGTYPDLDTLLDSRPSALGQFFPVIYFRKNNAAIDKITAEYTQATKLTKTLGMDYDAVVENIQANPDISKVERAFMLFAVPPNSTNSVELKYLFDFFSKMHTVFSGVSSDTGWSSSTEVFDDDVSAIYDTFVPRVVLNIQDAHLSTVLTANGVYRKTLTGSNKTKGTYSGEFKTETKERQYTVRESQPIVGFVDVVKTSVINTDVFVYTYQVTEVTYIEVKVYDLRMTYNLYQGYSMVGDNLDPILLIPLDRAITGSYPLADRELLYSRAMHYVFNSRTIQEIKWYQSDGFVAFLQVGGVVLTIISMGADGGLFSQIAAAATIATAAAIQTLVVNILLGILKGALISAVAALFVQAVGGDLAVLVALVITAYVAYSGVDAGNFTKTPRADLLLNAASNLTSEATESVVDAFNTLKTETEGFDSYVKEQLSLIEKKSKLYERSNLLKPMDLIRESAEDFYNRTVHSGNVGVKSIESVTSYVDIALTLPKYEVTGDLS